MREPFIQFEIGLLKNFVYLVLDWETKLAAVVDPQSNLSPVYEFLEKNSFKLQMILLTHTHHDHVAGVVPLLKKESSICVYVNQEDTHRLHKSMQERIVRITDNQVVHLGKTQIKVLHTPGHSAGESCFFISPSDHPPFLLTGDTLFIRDCGRTDLETGSNEEMFKSLQRIKTFPKETIILPGHHYKEECTSTLEIEMRESPPLQVQSVEELVRLP
jgi:glyoxylase-like metal-dependent hydrolase (beta-lactamase superfamily II)